MIVYVKTTEYLFEGMEVEGIYLTAKEAWDSPGGNRVDKWTVGKNSRHINQVEKPTKKRKTKIRSKE